MNSFELNFDKSLTKLSGYDLGREMFENQIKDGINYNSDEIVIKIPSRVDLIGSSFIQGFFEDIVKNIGIAGIATKIQIEAQAIPNVKQMILENLD